MTVTGVATESFSLSVQAVVWQRATVTRLPADPAQSTQPAGTPVPAPAPAPVATEGHGDRARVSERARALFAALDGDGDGAVTKDEFVEGARAILSRPGEDTSRVSDEKLARLFDKIDRNDDGAVKAREIGRALRRA